MAVKKFEVQLSKATRCLVAKLRVGGQESMISPLLSSPCDTKTSLPRVRQAMAVLFEVLFKSLWLFTVLQFSGRSTQRRPI